MPRDGSNVYSLPEAPFVAGTTATAAAQNNNLSDIAAALTDSVCRSTETTAYTRSLLNDADAPTARATLGAPAAPQNASGVGQVVRLESGAGNALSLPSGGTWFWFALSLDGAGAITSFNTSVSAGGFTIASASPGINVIGSCWRIA